MLGLLGWVPIIPLVGFLILLLEGKRLSKLVISWVGVGSVGVALILVNLIGLEFISTMQPYRLLLGYWIKSDDLSVPFGFYLDALSMTMLFIVTSVGLLIHIYSAGFMESDSGYARFFAYMNLFVSAMLLLVLADNLFVLYLGWEGVGLGSYLLIGFWYENPKNGYAARKAFIMTRVGDTALTLSLLLLFTHLHTLDIQSLMSIASSQWKPGSFLPVASAALLLGGAVGKSAQWPLLTWLPDAMAGPTPVSALIHAATMVTAGVYLIARTHALFLLAPTIQFTVALIGLSTLIIAGCSALVQTDIKRILAYSTISQIGYMFLALGVSAWAAAIFHLLTHAFFKALLFLAAGAAINCLHHEQNIFNMGGLRKVMPLTFWSFMIGSAALAALPFTSGYFSKHEILMATFGKSPILWSMGCLGAVITGIYSFRLVFVVFFGAPSQTNKNKLDWRMSVPLLLLCGLALFGGLFNVPLNSVFPPLTNYEHRQVSLLVSVFTEAAPILGVMIAGLFYLTRTFSTECFENYSWLIAVQKFLLTGWYMDLLFRNLLENPFKAFTKLNKNDVIDRFYLGVAWISRWLHMKASSTQTGLVRWYATSITLGTVVILTVELLS